MNNKNVAKYVMERCKLLSTFDVDSWDNDYNFKHHANRVFNTANIPEGTVRQSLYMTTGGRIYMGILDCEPGFGNDDIELDMDYNFDTRVITMNYNNITHQEEKEDMEDDTEDFCTITYELTDSESQYFQTSLVNEPMFEFEDEVMMITFFEDIRERFYKF